MHILTYVVIDHKEFIDTSDLDIHDVQSAVEEILIPAQGHMWDWYEIGGRWVSHWPNNIMTVKEFLAQDKPVMPCIYFDHQGNTYDEDEYIGLIRLMGWQHNSPTYLNYQRKIKDAMHEAIKQCHPDDLIVIVDLHN